MINSSGVKNNGEPEQKNAGYRKDLSNETIRLIEKKYGIEIGNPGQLFLGADRDTFVYKVNSKNGKIYFLKIRTGIFNESSIVIPYLLSQKIGRHIIAPIQTTDGKLFITDSELTIVLYPFIDGRSGKEIDLTDDQLIGLGKTLRQIHEPGKTGISQEKFGISCEKFYIPCEKFENKWIPVLTKYMNELDIIPVDNETTRQYVNMLGNRKNTITEIMERAEKLHAEILYYGIKNLEPGYCLCHADLHAANILIAEDDFYIIDWDTMIMAPKERDLMFIGSGITGKWNTKRETDLFYLGYWGEPDSAESEKFTGSRGNTKVNRTILDYYRFTRIIEDIVVYHDQFFEAHCGEENRRLIAERVESNFLPGSTVEMAFGAD